MSITMGLGPQQFAKYLILVGLLVAAVGVLALVLSRFGLFRLPGDIEFGSKSWRFYFPIASCVIISIILTIIFWLINYLRRSPYCLYSLLSAHSNNCESPGLCSGFHVSLCGAMPPSCPLKKTR